ncbi:MAG: hypothetical protein JWO12_2864 [Frankiales bacterium]|nr:hypothetical protein [Frankiales bacterium]
MLVFAGLAARVLVDSSSELLTAADDLTHVRGAWLAAAVIAELASYVGYGAALRQLLRSGGGGDVALLPMSAVGIASQAAAYCLPGGVAVSGAVTFRRLSRRGVDPAMTGWVLAVSTVLYLAALAALALVGAEVAGDASSSVPDLRLTSLVVLAVVGVAAVLLYLLRHLSLPGRSLRWCAAWLDRVVVRLRPEHPSRTAPISEWAGDLSRTKIDGFQLVVAGGLLLVVWLSDALCLALAFFALGSAPPWQGLLLAYCAAQLAAMLPFTPGGLGVVEGSLTVALVAYGGSAPTALSAVLLYRLISFWGLLPAGATCYAGLRWGERHPPPNHSRGGTHV